MRRTYATELEQQKKVTQLPPAQPVVVPPIESAPEPVRVAPKPVTRPVPMQFTPPATPKSAPKWLAMPQFELKLPQSWPMLLAAASGVVGLIIVVSVAGALLSTDEPQKVLPEATIVSSTNEELPYPRTTLLKTKVDKLPADLQPIILAAVKQGSPICKTSDSAILASGAHFLQENFAEVSPDCTNGKRYLFAAIDNKWGLAAYTNNYYTCSQVSLFGVPSKLLAAAMADNLAKCYDGTTLQNL